jgi:hypothetical protein
MKSRIGKTAIMLLFCLLCAAPALAVRTGDEGNGMNKPGDDMKAAAVPMLDSLYFDGKDMDVSYTVRSCFAEFEHSAILGYTLDGTEKAVSVMKITVSDYEPAADCPGRQKDITVESHFDFGQWLDDTLYDLESQGYHIDESTPLLLPELRSTLLESGPSVDKEKNSGTPIPPRPSKVNVTEVTYKPGFKCVLNKSDGSRNDGFEGYGETLDAARAAAARGCAGTNNPNCSTWSSDPNHTTCDVSFETTEKVTSYDRNAVPDGAKTVSYGCTLYKKDGSSKDGFDGTGATEEEARTAASNACKTTNNPYCDAFAQNAEHISCLPNMRLETPKPTAEWRCSLWKRDGARKDGFDGAGPTEREARRDAASGCARTNHPSCEAFSMDPAHTECTVAFE